VTDLEQLYAGLRRRGLGHRAALASLAEALDVDEACIKRQLDRARANEARPHRPKKED
jgi:hypothetical protein